MPHCVKLQLFYFFFKAVVLSQGCTEEQASAAERRWEPCWVYCHWKGCSSFPSSLLPIFPSLWVSSTYLQNINHIPSNTSLRYSWLPDFSIWLIDNFLSAICASSAMEFSVQIYHLWYTYNEKHIVGSFQYNTICDEGVIRHFFHADVNRNLYSV